MNVFKVGKRSLKTCLAMAIALMLYILLVVLNRVLGFTEVPGYYVTSTELWYVPSNWYTPFFAAIATIYAMSANIAASKKQATIRSIGSVIGGYWGYIITFIYSLLFPNMVKGNLDYYISLYATVVLGLIPMMWIIKKAKMEAAGFISGLTYCAVTISIRNGGMGPLLFTTNRVLSTIIGVGISVYINSYPHIKRRGKGILFISALDGALYDLSDRIPSNTVNRLADLKEIGAHITYMTPRPYTYAESTLRNVGLNESLIVNNGAAIYTPGFGYHDIKTIEPESARQVKELFDEDHISVFSYVFNMNRLFCYYDHVREAGAMKYYDEYENTGTPFVMGKVPEELNVSEFVVIVKTKQMDEVIERLEHIKNIGIFTSPFDLLEGYSFIRVTSDVTTIEHTFNMVGYQYEHLVVIGGEIPDIPMMERADYAICLSSAAEEVQQKADLVIDGNDSAKLVEMMRKLYFAKKYPWNG